MGSTIRKAFTPAYKAKVALEAIKGVETVGQLASRYQVHPTQIGVWRKQVLEGMEHLFSDKLKRDQKETSEFIEELYKQIGKKDIQIEWLKKMVGQLNTE